MFSRENQTSAVKKTPFWNQLGDVTMKTGIFPKLSEISSVRFTEESPCLLTLKWKFVALLSTQKL